MRVCVWVNDRTTERPTETKPNNRDRLLQHQQHQRYFCLTSTFKAHATPISLTKYYARTHARTHCVHVRKKKHTQRHRLNIQHTAVTPLLHIRLLYLCLPYSSSNDTQRSAAHRNDHHRSNQQQTTNQKKKYQRRG